MEMKWREYLTRGLNLYGNPLTDPPVEIVKQGKDAVQNYFAEIEKKAAVLFLESKLLLVGSGDVGKTTLMKKLKDNKFVVVPGKEDTTRGIDIQPWLDIRDELNARPENYISLEGYYAVCRSHQMEPDKALFLSDYLHDLGIILHFRQDPVLADTVILKPGWGTGAV